MRALATAAFALTTALAAVPAARADTTDEVVGYCTEFINGATRAQRDGKAVVEYPETHPAGICWGYADAMFYVFAKSELIRMFLDYVARHPDAREHRPSFVFYWAAYERHPCPR
jgi:hypothetical protein